MRRSVPNTFIASGISPRVGCSNSNAGPCSRSTRCDDAGNLQVRVDRRAHPRKIAVSLQRGQKALQIRVAHDHQYPWGPRGTVGRLAHMERKTVGGTSGYDLTP